MQWISISPLTARAPWRGDCTDASVAPRDKTRIVQIRILRNHKTEGSVCVTSMGITSQTPLLPPIVTKVCSLRPARQTERESLESFGVAEEGLFSTTGCAGVYVADEAAAGCLRGVCWDGSLRIRVSRGREKRVQSDKGQGQGWGKWKSVFIGGTGLEVWGLI